MNKQEQPRAKTSNSRRHLRIGGAMLLIGLLIFTVSWNALYGQGPGAGFELLFLFVFLVFPLLVIGGLLLLRGLVRKTSSIVLVLLGCVTVLIDYLAFSHLYLLAQNENPYPGVGE